MIGRRLQSHRRGNPDRRNFFAALKPKPWIRVVEAKFVPKTTVAGWMLVVSTPHEMESIGDRIIETPENLQRTELRDDSSGFPCLCSSRQPQARQSSRHRRRQRQNHHLRHLPRPQS